jgi:hypothetical protein
MSSECSTPGKLDHRTFTPEQHTESLSPIIRSCADVSAADLTAQTNLLWRLHVSAVTPDGGSVWALLAGAFWISLSPAPVCPINNGSIDQR